MKIIDFFLSSPENKSLFYKHKSIVLTVLNLLLFIVMLGMVIFTFTRTDIDNHLKHNVTPLIILLVVVIDLVLLKFKSYQIAANFITIFIAAAFCFQLLFIKPDFFFGDFTSTFYFVFAIYSLSAIFSTKRIYFIVVIAILICLIINIKMTYNDFPEEYISRYPSIIAYFFFALTLSTLIMYFFLFLNNKSQLKTIEDSKKMYELYGELQFQNQYLEQIVAERTKEIEEQNKIIELRNKDLQARNEEINSQKEKIQSQSDILQNALNKVKEQHNEINAALRYALTIQEAILPLQESLTEIIDYFIYYKPFGIVSGDFYWYAAFKTERFENIYFSVIDCTGHGVPGAFMSLLGYNLLNEIVKKSHIFETNMILETLDKEVRSVLKQEQTRNHDGMDMIICQLHRSSSKCYVEFSGAKRPMIIYSKKNSEINFIKGDYRSIGGYHKMSNQFTKHKIKVERGDLIFLFTDGITDQINANNKKFGISRLKSLILNHADKPVEELEKIFYNKFENYKASEMQIDDMTLVCIQV